MSRPTYLRIADDIRHRIQDGRLSPGERVPSRAQLSRRYTVSDRVAIEAIKVLMNEGLVEGRPGSGTYVRRRPEARRLHREPPGVSPPVTLHGARRATSQEAAAPPSIAERFGVDAGSEVMRTDHVFCDGDEPVMLATSWEPLSLTRGTPVMWPDRGPLAGLGPLDRMGSIGVTVTRVEEAISVRPALEEESQGLDLPRSAIVIVLSRTCLAEKRPVEIADFVFSAERHELWQEFGV
ncbi:GntR family transcriptional regulator [Actinomadura alba]|uniref:GntR family transcriptional regulator n=1 Tax=Actinomadura alba TaxID=406431 RepID=A0ABR7LH53_9ACTN|nr:GntR family transcriptional regulator [Actinomadura alba]MBC6464123.1 GntR family transcriptional regulator [Actinomadura alba]